VISLPTIPAWVEDAVCASSDPEIWQPRKGESGKVRKAKAICATCPALSRCLDDAIDRNERHGVWGGLTTLERDEYRRLRPALRAEYAQAALARHDAPIVAPEDDSPTNGCGTLAGYKRHISERTTTCAPCKAANAEYQREKRIARGATPRRRQPLDTQPAPDWLTAAHRTQNDLDERIATSGRHVTHSTVRKAS